MSIRAFAAQQPKGELKAFEYDPGALGDEQVEIAVSHCGICHSDLSMLDNDWGMSAYPLVAGHEVVGTVTAVGSRVATVKPGARVGLGWYSQSCMRCRQCMSGDHNLCPTAEQTIVGRHGGFANKVRAHWAWATPLPEGIDPVKAGPLFCGGLTVFNPLVQFDVRPTHRVGIVGIGGLGHMAVQFANKWGCEVVAFSSSAGKTDEAKRLGAHHVVNSKDDAAMQKIAGTLDLILVTVNVPLNWPAYIAALAPKGRLHFVGAVLEPIAVPAMAMIMPQKSLSGSPLGSPVTTADMLAFCARHKIEPVTETFPLTKVNDALAHVRAGKARYRVVLENDLKV
ncbi:alcohol dehydrogenase : Zinc-containing alcohol dehydrogenase superfamily protein OS=Blastopirellula marina DSM 3645 GN=DSM3645_08987 PE=3 SV=1: ADH_N: ADH_zinc_N [Gemmata massiliana]|uniref:alcohol dehydrogenase (NADP(+)) n=1 Tax=Gemmata massiliana TaxID=1210884 RepID=A0A6P2DJK0_9BACT|nr:NAD(P)-dependent alcohol dehydrogenase [Gemmata massiliana]VTS02942.1 alcohol dehydrogenase : Zinc-containing alcohol dehydrogenase superfamily protein OS=Blastopirellula marina DSM 3645 GN=DSM3645_08987 PE=3 SV=1: ADH_N: ADH_zinc_N [Gemmata massiliana]